MPNFKSLIILLVLICLTASGSAGKVIDSFDYAEPAKAQEAWKPQSGSPTADVTFPRAGHDGKALALGCNFSEIEGRCHWDKVVALDFSRFGRFSIWINVTEPQAVRIGTIYFQSGDGWYSGWMPVEKTGWQKVSLWKSDFQVEGTPLGWAKISKIKLSFWKAENIDTLIAVDDLEAIADDIMIVLGDQATRENSPQARSIRQFCRVMGDMVAEIGLDFGVVSDTDVASGALSGCKLAIFPYNPNMSEQETEAIIRFVKSGGKIMLFYLLPDRLAEILGIRSSQWMQAEYPGQLSSIEFDAKTIDGLPDTVFQGSWNATIPRPKNAKTRIIGHWINYKNKDTKLPAITINPNGIFMAHVLTNSDRLMKKRMLMTLFGELVPNMRESIVRAALQNAEQLAGFENPEQTSQFIRENLKEIPDIRRAEVLIHLIESKMLLSQAKQADRDNLYSDTLDLARDSMAHLQEAYFRSIPTKEEEFRAFWCHSAMGVQGWSWNKAIKYLKRNGLNAIFPNMLWGGVAYYPSEVLPTAAEVKKHGDQIALCLKACKKYGVEMHVWKVNWNLSHAPEEFVEKMRREGRLQKNREGEEIEWLCPSDPKNFIMERESLLEIVRKYDVDGIHFDYIRYPNMNSCYCFDCKESFENSAQIEVENWPEDAINGEHSEIFVQWRCDLITGLVESVSKNAKEINPRIKISAAVFRDYPGCRKSVGQDWNSWVQAGYLDFVCPMNYTANNDQFENVVTNQLRYVDGKVPLYPGIGASAPGLASEQVVRQIHIARKLGTSGFIIFEYNVSTAKEILPDLFKGATYPNYYFSR